jgi:hypothetical protein
LSFSVITVPSKLVLGVTRAQSLGAMGEFIRTDERVSRSPVVVLALSLLYERSIGAKSTWKVSTASKLVGLTAIVVVIADSFYSALFGCVAEQVLDSYVLEC